MKEKTLEKKREEKRYLIIMQDEWNNLYYLGEYKKLSESIQDINDWLEEYGVSIKEEDLVEYPSTFSSAFDLDLMSLYEDNESLAGVMVRGFILEG